MKKLFLSLILLVCFVAPAQAALDLTNQTAVTTAFEALKKAHAQSITMRNGAYLFGAKKKDSSWTIINPAHCEEHFVTTEPDNYNPRCYTCRLACAYNYLEAAQVLHAYNHLATINNSLGTSYTLYDLLDIKTRKSILDAISKLASTTQIKSSSKLTQMITYLDTVDQLCKPQKLALLNELTELQCCFGSIKATDAVTQQRYTREQKQAASRAVSRLAWRSSEEKCPTHKRDADLTCTACRIMRGKELLKPIIAGTDYHRKTAPQNPAEQEFIATLIKGTDPLVQPLPEAHRYEELLEAYHYFTPRTPCEHGTPAEQCTQDPCVTKKLVQRHEILCKKIHLVYGDPLATALTADQELICQALCDETDPYPVPPQVLKLNHAQEIVAFERHELEAKGFEIPPSDVQRGKELKSVYKQRVAQSKILKQALRTEFASFAHTHHAQITSELPPLSDEQQTCINELFDEINRAAAAPPTPLTTNDKISQETYEPPTPLPPSAEPDTTQPPTRWARHALRLGYVLSGAWTLRTMYKKYTRTYTAIKEQNPLLRDDEVAARARAHTWHHLRTKKKGILALAALTGIGLAIDFGLAFFDAV